MLIHSRFVSEDANVTYARDWAARTPFYARMGIAVETMEPGRARLRLDVDEGHRNADGIVHGGVLPALADAAMGSAARTLHGASAQLLTAESNLRYVRAVSGGRLLADGRVVKAGRRVVFVEVEVTDAGEAVARGGGTFVIQPAR